MDKAVERTHDHRAARNGIALFHFNLMPNSKVPRLQILELGRCLQGINVDPINLCQYRLAIDFKTDESTFRSLCNGTVCRPFVIPTCGRQCSQVLMNCMVGTAAVPCANIHCRAVSATLAS